MGEQPTLWQSIKAGVGYLLAPLAFIAGFIYYLFAKNRTLEDELVKEKADKQLQGALTKEDEAKKDADTKEADYNAMLAKYKSDAGSGEGKV